MIEKNINAKAYNIEELLYNYDANETKEQEQKKEKKLFLFLEADYFENAQEEVEEMDINANTKLLWENSQLWHEHRANGPLIVETSNSSPIFKKFIEKWSEENRGVVITTEHTLQELTQHLQSLIFVTEPNNTLTRLRLYEPRKLRGVLDSMQEPNDLSELMGCIEEFIWQENCGLDEAWLSTKNPNPHAPRHNIHDENWFRFTQEQNEIIDEHEEHYFCKKISYKLKSSFKILVTQKEAYIQISKLNQEAKEQRFLKEDDKEEYIRLRLMFGDFRLDDEVVKIVNDKYSEMGGKLMKIKNYFNLKKGAVNG